MVEHNPEDKELLMTLEDIAVAMGVTGNTVRRWVRERENGGKKKDDGFFPYFEFNGRHFTTKERFYQWLDEKMAENGFAK